jgi:hypothetical protein
MKPGVDLHPVFSKWKFFGGAYVICTETTEHIK